MPQSSSASPASRPEVSELLRVVLDVLPCGVVVLDTEGLVERANPAAAALLGVELSALLGLTRDEWEELLRRSLEPDAEPARYRTAALPRRTVLRETHCHSHRTLEVLRDVTGEARSQQDLQQLKERHARELTALHTRLDQVEAFKMELTANVTHDLRTPLAAIKASVSGLLAGDVKYDKQQLRETLSVIEEETDRLQRRVSNLLSMARMESGASDLSEDWVDLSDVVASAVEVLKNLRGERQIRFTFPEELPLVQGDYIQLQIAIRNLVENALLYSPPDEPIEVQVSANLGQVRVRVRDYGPGLMPDESERVFDKFYRGRSARRIPGTGLGLPICRGIAEAHGGRLWAEHAPGGGVEFVLSLPASETVPLPTLPAPDAIAGAAEGEPGN